MYFDNHDLHFCTPYIFVTVYILMAHQVGSILHLKCVYTVMWPWVSTLCRHKVLVVFVMMWPRVSTFWCHQKVDKVSTFWWHMSSLSSHLSSLWCHQTMSTFWSHAKCLPCEASPFYSVPSICLYFGYFMECVHDFWFCLTYQYLRHDQRNEAFLFSWFLLWFD